MSESPLVLAIDVGTSSSRAMVFDSWGKAVEGLKAQITYAPRTEPPGTSEFDADFLVNQIAACIDEALAEAGDSASRIAAVGMCTFWHSMAGIDGHGRAVTPLYTWADSRAAEAARKLQLKIENCKLKIANWHSRTGCAIHPSYFPARLLWLAESNPRLFRKARQWVSPGEYFYRQIFGMASCSISMASASGLFNQDACDWDDVILSFLPIARANLPEIADLGSPAHKLLPEWAKRWPALAEIPWVPAIGDGAASNLGSGCSTERRIAINLGTSGAIRVLWAADSVDIPPELWCYRLDRKRFVMGGAFSDGGDVHAWMKKTLRLPDDDDALERELAGRQPDSHGLTFLPFLAGERSVGWRPDARATLEGLTVSTDPLEILQCGMEGVALRYALVADILRERFPEADEIVASGGAIGNSPVWARMIADAIGHDIILSAEPEASSRGAALVALKAAGILKDEGDAAAPLGKRVATSAARHRRYRAALDRQQKLYARMSNQS